MGDYYWIIDGVKVAYVRKQTGKEYFSADIADRYFLKINGRLYAKNGADYYPLSCKDDPLPIGDLNGVVAAGNKVLELKKGNAVPIKDERYLFAADNKLLCLDEYMYVRQRGAFCRCNGELVIDNNLDWWVVEFEGRIYLFRQKDGKKQFVRSFETCYPNGIYLDDYGREVWQLCENGLIRLNDLDKYERLRYDEKADKLIFSEESYIGGEQGTELYVHEYVRKNGKYVLVE